MKAWYAKAMVGGGLLGVLLFTPDNSTIAEVDEVAVQLLRVRGGPESSGAELSGLAWLDDELVLLPQYPSRFPTAEGGGVFIVSRADIDRALDPEADVVIDARVIPFVASGLEESMDGFEGFEAMAFHGAEVFVTIEQGLDHGRTRSHLLKGRVQPGLSAIILDTTSMVPLEPQTDIENLGYESLTIHRGRVYAFYEANGSVNASPRAEVFDTELRRLDPAVIDQVEYRITDASTVDSSGRFWATNYFYEGDCWETDSCPMRERFGVGRSHRGRRTVERLIELQISDVGVGLTDTPPIELELTHGPGRNWEGIVRYGDRGFLIVSDKYPASMIAFVPRPAG